jgi:hypothetical protein
VAANKGGDRVHELRGIHGLGHVHVEAGVEGAVPVLAAGKRRHGYRGQARITLPGPDPANQRVTVLARHRDVADEHVGGLAVQRL